jgi:uncharacterized membrane protein YkvA (DUF1232 family)
MVTATEGTHQCFFAMCGARCATIVVFFNGKANFVLKKLTHLALVCLSQIYLYSKLIIIFPGKKGNTNMSLSITFELQEPDLDYFRQIMAKTQSASSALNQQQILAAAKKLALEVNGKVPEFVASRIQKLQQLVALVEDKEWDLTDEEKAEVLSALAYFAKPEDLIADHVPVLGFLDDAIMIELVAQSLADDIQAYDEFCKFRTTEAARRGAEVNPSKADWLETKKQELHSWMRRRRAERRSGGGGGFRSIFRAGG